MRTIIATILTAALAVALPTSDISPQTMPSARIAIEAGQGDNATTTTIMVPIGMHYTNETALAQVSTLYLLSPVSITCIPYTQKIPTGFHGNPFSVGHPCEFSKEPARIGCIRCVFSSGPDVARTEVEGEH